MGNVPPSALRQPPPPPRRCLLVDSNTVPAPTTSKAEGDTSRVRSQPLYFRRCRKANSSNSMIESLPDELLMEILVRLSADDIYDNARLVCRRWFYLIHSDAFVREHLHRASSGLLISPIFMTATTQGRVEISKLSCRLNFPIVCSCNGLALCLRKVSRGILTAPFIFNPATKCAFNLPRFPIPVSDRLSMAYAAASMAYKVVGLYFKSGTVLQCAILTVGVDNSWRHVHVAVEGLPPEAKCALVSRPLMTEGFVHWASRTLMVSLNVETEIFTLTPTPALMFPRGRRRGYYPLSTGECLSQFVSRGDWSWEVWEMKPETWEWRKVLPNLDLEAHKSKIQQFASQEDDVLVKPVGWVRYPEVLAFFFNNTDCSCVIYNLDTNEIESIELSFPAGHRFVGQHRSSLVWSERC